MHPPWTDRILTQKDLRDIIPLSRSQIWRLEKAGEFPKRIRIGLRKIGWRESEITVWLETRCVLSIDAGDSDRAETAKSNREEA